MQPIIRAGATQRHQGRSEDDWEKVEAPTPPGARAWNCRRGALGALQMAVWNRAKGRAAPRKVVVAAQS